MSFVESADGIPAYEWEMRNVGTGHTPRFQCIVRIVGGTRWTATFPTPAEAEADIPRITAEYRKV